MQRVLLADGLTISRVVTGLWQVADMERDGRPVDLDAAADAMVQYVDSGFTTFDMADHYGSAEDIVGRFARRHPQRRVELLTKWVPKPGPVDRGTVVSAVQRSLDRMGVASVDLLQFHVWNYADPSWLDALSFLMELRESGRIRHVGLTNVDTAHLRMVVRSGFPIASNQVSCSVIDRRAGYRMAEFCRANGIALLAFGTLAGGLLSERWLDAADPSPNDLATWSAMKYRRYIDQIGGWPVFQDLLHRLKRVARRHDVSIANVAGRYVLDSPGVTAIIVGARLGQDAHLASNRRLDELRLDGADRAELVSVAVGQIGGDCGDEYRRPPFLTASGDLSHHIESFPAPFPVTRGPADRSWALSGTHWERLGGFSRAVRIDDHVYVSGTTATHQGKVVGGSDAGAQAVFVFDKIEGALQSLGGTLDDVVRTRIYVRRLADWEAVAREHGERFGKSLPANTLVQAALVGDEYLVEVEAEAILTNPKPLG